MNTDNNNTYSVLDSPKSPSLIYFTNILPITPDRSVPASPTLAPAAVTHTNATTRHLHTNDDTTTAVDSMELTKLLQHVASNKRKSQPPPTSPITTTSTSSTNSSVSSLRPSLGHRLSSSLNTVPSQFIFKKPLYNQHYHQTHFHHSSPPSSPITPSLTHHSSSQPKDMFLSELKRFFGSHSETVQENQPFANQFRQNISSRYGQWGKENKKEHFL